MNTYGKKLEISLVKARGIQPATAKNYVTNIKAVRKIIDPDMEDPQWYTKHLEIFKAIAHSPQTTRMTRLTALTALSELESNPDSRKVYKAEYTRENTIYKAWVNTQVKSDSQKKNWATPEELYEVRDKLLTRANKLFPKESLSSAEFSEVQNAVSFALYLEFPIRNVFGGMTIIARRDFRKLPPDDQETKNYYVFKASKSFIHLAKYKTVRSYGIRDIPTPPTIHKMLIKWINVNPTESLFVSKRQGSLNLAPMDSKNFGRLISRISFEHLGRKTGTTLIRHILITKANEDKPTIEDEEKADVDIQNRFLHSSQMHKTYRKID